MCLHAEHEQIFAIGEKVYADGLDTPHVIRGYRPGDNNYALDMGEDVTLWFPWDMLTNEKDREHNPGRNHG